jgi:hypothetical protein
VYVHTISLFRLIDLPIFQSPKLRLLSAIVRDACSYNIEYLTMYESERLAQLIFDLLLSHNQETQNRRSVTYDVEVKSCNQLFAGPAWLARTSSSQVLALQIYFCISHSILDELS